MEELLDIVNGLSADERRDLMIILAHKYREDFMNASKILHWPSYINNASEQVKRMLNARKS